MRPQKLKQLVQRLRSALGSMLKSLQPRQLKKLDSKQRRQNLRKRRKRPD